MLQKILPSSLVSNCTSLCLSITITYTTTLVISVANIEIIHLA
ncbi:hypothetical protein V12B01_13635 [Vibrio splendidus 12B01]|nr:hypothetical protein V12B01_13635 [Vibrio splendidus 12B01]